MVQWVGSTGGQDRGCLADIQRAAAAESQNGVATRFGDQRHRSAYPLDRWLGRDSERNARDAGLGKHRPDGVRPCCRTAGDNQNATRPERGERSWHLADSASPEPYIGRDCQIDADHAVTSRSPRGIC